MVKAIVKKNPAMAGKSDKGATKKTPSSKQGDKLTVKADAAESKEESKKKCC